MRLIFMVVKDKLDRKFGCFEVFGFDILLDDSLRPHLIEINTNPALFTDTNVQKEMLPKLVDDVIKMALEIHEFGKTDGKSEAQRVLENILNKETQLQYKTVFSEI